MDPNAIRALNQMKAEIANELGIADQFDNKRGTLLAGENVFMGGRVGGNMTRRLIEAAEKSLINKEY